MFHWTSEGQTLSNGFNFYRLSDKSSAGVKIRIFNRMVALRYSKQSGKFMAWYAKSQPAPEWAKVKENYNG